jgi:hypothetical protein
MTKYDISHHLVGFSLDGKGQLQGALDSMNRFHAHLLSLLRK